MEEKKYDMYWEGNEHRNAPCGQRVTYVKEGRVWAYFFNKPEDDRLSWKFKKKMTWWKDRKLRKRINEFTR